MGAAIWILYIVLVRPVGTEFREVMIVDTVEECMESMQEYDEALHAYGWNEKIDGKLDMDCDAGYSI
jgi:hypothetical protein